MTALVDDQNDGRTDHWRVAMLSHPSLVGELPSVRVMWGVLLIRMNDEGWCYPSFKWLLAASGLTEKPVRRAIRRLEEIGLIDRIARFRHGGKGSQIANRLQLTARAKAAREDVHLYTALTRDGARTPTGPRAVEQEQAKAETLESLSQERDQAWQLYNRAIGQSKQHAAQMTALEDENAELRRKLA